MPTFRNDTMRYIDYEAIIQKPNGLPERVLIRFAPREEKGLPFWIPYVEKGLTLVDADYPVVPNSILVSGTFKFTAGQERKFTIEPCDAYTLNVIMQTGTVKVYMGNSRTPVEVDANAEKAFDFKTVLDWEFAPYIRVVAVSDAEATIHAEVNREFKTMG